MDLFTSGMECCGRADGAVGGEFVQYLVDLPAVLLPGEIFGHPVLPRLAEAGGEFGGLGQGRYGPDQFRRVMGIDEKTAAPLVDGVLDAA